MKWITPSHIPLTKKVVGFAYPPWAETVGGKYFGIIMQGPVAVVCLTPKPVFLTTISYSGLPKLWLGFILLFD